VNSAQPSNIHPYICTFRSDWDLIGKDDELRKLVIPLKNVATDTKNFFEVVNEYEGTYSFSKASEVEQLAPPLVNSGMGSVKVRITFEGKDWAAAQEAEAAKLIKDVQGSGSKLDLGKLQSAAETFMKTSDGKTGEYVIKSKAMLQNFLEQAGLVQMVLDFDAFSSDKLMVYSPEKMKSETISSYEKERLKKEDDWRSQQLELLWAMCDVDGDGTVTFQELMMILAIQSHSDPVQRGELAFRLLDRDNSGTLSKAEMLKLQRIYYKSFKILFKVEFLNKVREEGYKKGVFLSYDTMEEITKKVQQTLDNANVPEALTEKIFSLADKDESGDVSKEEYLNFLKDKDNEAAMTDFLGTLLATVGLTAGLQSAAVILKKGAKSFY
jgi:Ca2+-binding EF-hand superfamily protein